MIEPTAAAAVNTHEVVSDLLDPPGARLVLDVGAGRGNFTAHLEKRGYIALALDIDRSDYESAGYAISDFVECDLDSELAVDLEFVDGAVLIEVIEHLEAPLAALRRVAAAVRTGGFIIVTTPNVMSLGSRLELLVRGHHEDFDDYAYSTNGHISPVSLVQLTRMGERLGLMVEVVTYNVGRLPLPRLRTTMPLTSARFRTSLFGESLIVKFRKTGEPVREINRG